MEADIEMGGKISLTRAKSGIFASSKIKIDKIGSKMNQKDLENSVLYQKHLFFAKILFADHTIWEDIILKAWEEAPQLIFP